MSMFNDIDWTKDGNYKECFRILSEMVRDGLGEEEKWYGTQNYKPEGQWNSTADVMVSSFEGSGHPVFRASGVTCTIHFSGDHSNAGLLFRTIKSANQFNIHGTIADWCDELTEQTLGHPFLSMEKSVAKVNEQLCRKLELGGVGALVQALETNVQAARERLHEHQENSKSYQER